MKKIILISLLVLLFAIGLCFVFTGFFIIQPIGAFPKGITIWYCRNGLNLPFISSPDGFLINNKLGVSLLGRALTLTKILELIKPKIILKLPYSKALYLISTNGQEFEK